MDSNWIHDQSLSGIDPRKLKQLSALAEHGNGLGQKELLPFLLAAASKSDKQHMNFSSAETQMILSVLKKNKSPEEQTQIDRVVQIFQQMQNRSRH